MGAGSTVTYVYDTNRSLPVVLSDGTLKYVWGLGLLYAVDGAGNLSVFHADGLGSVRALTDGSATLIATYQTDAWGNPTATGGSSTQPFRFAGEQLDADGLAYLRARFYEPGSGRLMTRDAIMGALARPPALNRYLYALNDPASRLDPSGMSNSRVFAPRRAFAESTDIVGLMPTPTPAPGDSVTLIPTATPTPGDVIGLMPTPTPTPGDLIGPVPTPTPTPAPPYSSRGARAVIHGTETVLAFGAMVVAVSVLFPPVGLTAAGVFIAEVGLGASAVGFAAAETELFKDLFGE